MPFDEVRAANVWISNSLDVPLPLPASYLVLVG